MNSSTTHGVRTAALVVGLLGLLPLRAQELAGPPVTAPVSVDAAAKSAEKSTPAERRILQQFGQTFVLGHSSRSDGVETEEYFLERESSESWTQMLTYQRVTLPEPMGTDQYVAWLKRHLEQTGTNGRLRVVQQSKEASLFGIQYPKSEKSEQQFGLALATIADPRRPNEIHVIQFTLNPERLSVEEMELQVKRWQARFQSQAASFSR